nr:MAG TPA: hypothetical protein [Caudoviricetes sp.]
MTGHSTAPLSLRTAFYSPDPRNTRQAFHTSLLGAQPSFPFALDYSPLLPPRALLWSTSPLRHEVPGSK